MMVDMSENVINLDEEKEFYIGDVIQNAISNYIKRHAVFFKEVRILKYVLEKLYCKLMVSKVSVSNILLGFINIHKKNNWGNERSLLINLHIGKDIFLPSS